MSSGSEESLEGSEWTVDKCITLMQLYRNSPILWDIQEGPAFDKTKLKAECWVKIGKVLDTTVEKCKRKMFILLASFRREKSKVKRSIQMAKNDPSHKIFVSPWYGFKYLEFLLDKDAERTRRQLAAGLIRPPWNKSIKKYSRQRRSQQVQSTSGEHKSITTKESKEPLRGSMTVCSQKTMPKATFNEEEINSFTIFMASKMKKYSLFTKNAVQREICKIIFEADDTLWENEYESDNNVDANTLTLSGQRTAINANDLFTEVKEEYNFEVDYSD